MHRGKPLALAVALAGLIGAGISAVSVAQSDATPATPPSTKQRILVLVPYGAPGAATTEDQDNSATDENSPADTEAAPGTDGTDATPAPDDQPSTAPDGTRRRMLILVPVPQGSDEDSDSSTDDGSDEDGNAPSDGRTLILVPQHAPGQLPPGVLSA